MSDFSAIYSEYFQHAHGSTFKIPKISPLSLQAVDRFFDGFTYQNPRVIFQKDFAWNLLYSFLGEFYSDLRAAGKATSEWVSFDKKANEIELDRDSLFALMVLLKRRIEKEVGTVRKMGFRDWVKHESYDGFCKDLHHILRRPDLRQGIMHGRAVDGKFFSSTKDVLEFLKGPQKILEAIEICRQRSPGPWLRRRGFRTKDELFDSAKVLLEKVKEAVGSKIRKYRITLRKCVKYILYLGLSATIQTRAEVPLSMSTEQECDFFTFYEPLRQAAMSLGWLQLSDSTYCPGVRCKSFIVKVMCNPVKYDPISMEMNRIEKAYMAVPYERRSEFAGTYGYNAHEYLQDRENVFLRIEDTGFLNKQKKRISFLLFEYSKTNGKTWALKKYLEKKEIESKLRMIGDLRVDFYNRYSDPRTYFWIGFGDQPAEAM